jgi:hypothetical protein
MRILHDDGTTYFPAWVAASRYGHSLQISVKNREFEVRADERAVWYIRARASDRGADWDWLPCLITPSTDGAVLLVGGWPLDDEDGKLIRVTEPNLFSFLRSLIDQSCGDEGR